MYINFRQLFVAGFADMCLTSVEMQVKMPDILAPQISAAPTIQTKKSSTTTTTATADITLSTTNISELESNTTMPSFSLCHTC